MKKERFQLGKMPQISVTTCHSDLIIRGWAEADVLVKGDGYELTESDLGISISSSDRLRIMVPVNATLTVNRVDGDLVVKNVNGGVAITDVAGDAILVGLVDVKINTILNDLSAKKIEGALSAGTVHGDVVARAVQTMKFETIHGDMSARQVNGDIRAGEIMGDVNLVGVNGNVNLEKVYRDANLRDLRGLAKLSDVRGDIRIGSGLAAGKHNFSAAGDIIMRWPEEARLNISVSAPKIVNRIKFDEITESDGSLEGHHFDSETFVSLTAKGSVVLKDARTVDEKWDMHQDTGPGLDFAFELEGLGEQISRQVNEQVLRITSDLENKFGVDYSQKIVDKIAKKAEWAAAKAEQAAERAIRQAERNMQRSSRHRTARSKPVPTKPKVSSEEQMKILKMVEQGTISVEEASTLLEALGE